MDTLAQQLADQAKLAPSVTRNEFNGLDPREVVDVRFFLKPEELDEATKIRKVASNQKKTTARVICGLGAIYSALVLYLHAASWSSWWQHRPEAAIFWSALLIVDLYVLLGQPGMAKLNRLANRLDVERRICVSHRGIDITHGRLRQQKSWKDFAFYQETPNIYLLHTTGASFWTLPKRAIPAGRGDQLQTLLNAKLPRR